MVRRNFLQGMMVLGKCIPLCTALTKLSLSRCSVSAAANKSLHHEFLYFELLQSPTIQTVSEVEAATKLSHGKLNPLLVLSCAV